MGVYVDNAKNRFGRMKMSHMFANTEAELNKMADKIGLDRKHIQRSRAGVVHYDVCQSKRDLAIRRGAVQVDAKQLRLIQKKEAD